jgi:hypothetical protein
VMMERGEDGLMEKKEEEECNGRKAKRFTT